MVINRVNIAIIDTQTNERQLEHEMALQDSVKLDFSGADDKLQNIMASRLDMEIGVPGGEDGRFLHLFTGSETRYQVVLSEVTDSENPKTIWRGFLLADIYQEPYKKGLYFVKFGATDGIGRLKNKIVFTEETYTIKEYSISKLIADCLRQAGDEIPLRIAPAFENSIVPVTYADQTVDMSSFKFGDTVDSAYDILEKLLGSMLCCLVQYGGYWNVVGINQLQERELNFQNYTFEGEYINSETVCRLNWVGVFGGEPLITMVPPLKTVNLDWDVSAVKNILPEDIVYQPESNSINTVKYWQLNNSAVVYLAGLDYRFWAWNFVQDDGFGVESETQDFVSEERASVFLSGHDDDFSLLSTPNISLLAKRWISADLLSVKQISLSITLKMIINSSVASVQSKIDSEDWDVKCYLDVLLGGEIVLSNRPGMDDAIYQELDEELTSEGVNVYADESLMVFSVENKVIDLFRSGYLDVKIYQPSGDSDGVSVGGVLIDELSVELVEGISDVEISKVRDIDFTGLQEYSVSHSFISSDLSESSISFREAVYSEGFTLTEPRGFYKITTADFGFEKYVKDSDHTQDYDGYTYAVPYFDARVFVEICDSVYLQTPEGLVLIAEKVVLDPPALYGDFQGRAYGLSVVWVNIDFVLIDINEDRGFYLRSYWNNEGYEDSFLSPDSEFYVSYPEREVFYPDAVPLLESWKRPGVDESKKLTELTANIIHDIHAKTLKKIEGSLFGLVGPLDLIEFAYLNQPANYQVSNLTMNLTRGKSEVVLIETTSEKVTDYIE